MNQKQRQALRRAETRHAKAAFRAALAHFQPFGYTVATFDTPEGTRDQRHVVAARQLVMGILVDLGVRPSALAPLLNRAGSAVHAGVQEYRKRLTSGVYKSFAQSVIEAVHKDGLPPRPDFGTAEDMDELEVEPSLNLGEDKKAARRAASQAS